MIAAVGRSGWGQLLSIALAVALVAVFAAIAAAKPSGRSVARTYVVADCTNAAFKPRQVILTCADAGLFATELEWKQWGRAQASADGVGKEKVCVPDCASGHYVKGEIRLHLFRPRLCPQDGHRHFTKARYSWPDGDPGGGPKQGTLPFPCSMVTVR
jgi:hypothetical protein